jgi:hypothetical protein
LTRPLVLIDPGATESFIYGAALRKNKNIKLKAVEQDEFSLVEMDLVAKQRVVGKVTTGTLTSESLSPGPTGMS